MGETLHEFFPIGYLYLYSAIHHRTLLVIVVVVVVVAVESLFFFICTTINAYF